MLIHLQLNFVKFTKKEIFAMVIFRLLALLALSSWLSTVNAASFDCSKSKTSVEKAICLDSNLSILDEQMKVEYDRVRADIVRRDELFKTQSDWRNLVRNPCTTLECLRLAYIARIEQLRRGDLAGWADGTTLGLVFSATDKKIEYLAAPNDLEWVRKWITQNKLLEVALSNMSMFARVRPTLSIVAASCPGQANAFYSPSKDRIVLCYELVNAIVGAFKTRISSGESSEAAESDRFFKALEYVLMHEFGHAVLHSGKPILGLGSPETEADNFATVLLIKKYKTADEQNQLLWGVWTFHNNSAKSTYKFDEFADEHDVPQQRQARFACNLAGANPMYFTRLKSAGLLAQNIRQDTCSAAWSRNAATVAQLSM